MIEKDKIDIKEDNVVSFIKNSNTESDVASSKNKMLHKDDYLGQMALEILKKSNISGCPEKVTGEFIKIYNMLNSNLVVNKKHISTQRQTVFDDYIICLEDGKKMKMLNRHLKTKYGMTFGDYKQKWGLPIDYPSVCKNYSKTRAEIAKRRKKNI